MFFNNSNTANLMEVGDNNLDFLRNNNGLDRYRTINSENVMTSVINTPTR